MPDPNLFGGSTVLPTHIPPPLSSLSLSFSPFPQLSSDSDSNVRYGAELLDRLMKVSPAESLRSVHVYPITYVHNGGCL